MSRIRSKNTYPEKAVWRSLRSLGIRHKRNVKDLPGKPDVLTLKSNQAIFINGCFWHAHKNCRRASTPKSNIGYWKSKIKTNVARDLKTARMLRRKGYSVLTIWECQTKDPEKLLKILKRKLCLRR